MVVKQNNQLQFGDMHHVVLWCVAFEKEVEIKAWEAGSSFCSLADHYTINTYIDA